MYLRGGGFLLGSPAASPLQAEQAHTPQPFLTREIAPVRTIPIPSYLTCPSLLISLLQRNTKTGLSGWNGHLSRSVGHVSVHRPPPLPRPPSLALQPINVQPVPSLRLVLFRNRTLHFAFLNVRFLLSRAALPSTVLATISLLTRFENLMRVCFISFSCSLVNTLERVGPWIHPGEIHVSSPQAE